jgi:hypothetical protein
LLFEVGAHPGDLMPSLYPNCWLAKMTGLPDELIETPGARAEWTF